MFYVRQHDPRPLTWWYEQYRAEKIDMEPSYQRRADIWSRWKRAHLIDSILNDYDVPKFYIADFARIRSRINEKNRPFAVIDGKQRFLAVFEFLNNQLALNNSATFEKKTDIEIGGLFYAELKFKHPKIAAKVEDFTPVVMSVVSDSDEKISEMFVRLNSGESVNRAERRNAMPGMVPRMIADLTMHPFFIRQIRLNTKRMQDFNLAAKLLLLEYNGEFTDTKAPDLDAFVNVGIEPSRNTKARLLEVEEAVQSVLERLASIFRDKDPLLSSQGGIPIYYWTLRNKPNVAARLRPFLETFTAELRENLTLSRVRPDEADAELMTYYTMGRTTNDRESLKGRYAIFVRRLRSYHTD